MRHDCVTANDVLELGTSDRATLAGTFPASSAGEDWDAVSQRFNTKPARMNAKKVTEGTRSHTDVCSWGREMQLQLRFAVQCAVLARQSKHGWRLRFWRLAHRLLT